MKFFESNWDIIIIILCFTFSFVMCLSNPDVEWRIPYLSLIVYVIINEIDKLITRMK